MIPLLKGKDIIAITACKVAIELQDTCAAPYPAALQEHCHLCSYYIITQIGACAESEWCYRSQK